MYVRISGSQGTEINVFYTFTNLKLSKKHFSQVESAKIKAIHSRLISRAVESHCDTIVVCQQHSHLRELANSILAFRNVKSVFCEASNSLVQAETIILLFGRSIKLVNFWLNKCNCPRGHSQITYGLRKSWHNFCRFWIFAAYG